MNNPAWPVGTQALLDDIVQDALSEAEQLSALAQAFGDRVALPATARVIGESVEVGEVDYRGQPRQGLRARVRRIESVEEYTVSVSELVFAEGSDGARLVAAYRRWMGLQTASGARAAAPSRAEPSKTAGVSLGPSQAEPTKTSGVSLDLSRPVDLIVLAPKRRAARCRVLGTDHCITLRSARVWDMVPGEIITVRGRKQWNYARNPYLSGDVESSRVDVGALALVPLRLYEQGVWDPGNEYWGATTESISPEVRRVIDRGTRPAFEMEHVLPSKDPDSWDDDPIIEACDLHGIGDYARARQVLTEALVVDLRCLDAHAHLGNFSFDSQPDKALRHYEVGVRIGELALGDHFDGVLPWGRINNRPFLRCMKGLGLCLWRLGRHEEAVAVFERMISLNPTDNPGVRFVLPMARAGEPWTGDL